MMDTKKKSAVSETGTRPTPVTSKKQSTKKRVVDEVEKFKADSRREFGNRLTNLREKHELTQPEMIRKFVESTPQTTSGYSRWETGTTEPGIAFLKQLHTKWKVDLNWLIAGDDSFVPELPVEVQNAIKVLDDFKRDCIFRK